MTGKNFTSNFEGMIKMIYLWSCSSRYDIMLHEELIIQKAVEVAFYIFLSTQVYHSENVKWS